MNATAAKSKPSSSAKKQKLAPGVRAFKRAAHAELTVPTKTGFVKATVDRGQLVSVSGSSVTLRYKTKKLTGDTVTLSIPSNARVRANGKKASLADLKAGQRVSVAKLPKRTIVRAHTPK